MNSNYCTRKRTHPAKTPTATDYKVVHRHFQDRIAELKNKNTQLKEEIERLKKNSMLGGSDFRIVLADHIGDYFQCASRDCKMTKEEWIGDFIKFLKYNNIVSP